MSSDKVSRTPAQGESPERMTRMSEILGLARADHATLGVIHGNL
jgi:hypothetical protein